MHYNMIRQHKRSAELRRLLGGKCGKCGADENLQFHHMDPKEKLFDITAKSSKPWEQLLVELKKCELRCVECHKKEHAAEHGIGMYTKHKCRCTVCKTAWNEKTKQYKKAAKERKAKLAGLT